MMAQEDKKRRAADRALELLKDDQVVGLGTGSTSKFAIEGVARRVSEGLSIKGVPTSVETERLARGLGIPIVSLNEVAGVDITFDGADEVDPDFNMIKGGGGALTREKLVALASTMRVIMIDDGKLVSNLGQSFSLPVEVLPFAWAKTEQALVGLGCVSCLRTPRNRPFVTDNGNYIVDCNFGPINDPAKLASQIKLLPGVVESGLFVQIADILVIGFEDRVEIRHRLH